MNFFNDVVAFGIVVGGLMGIAFGVFGTFLELYPDKEDMGWNIKISILFCVTVLLIGKTIVFLQQI